MRPAASPNTDLIDTALALRGVGMVCVPICAGGKHISFRAMDLPPYHVITARKRLKNAAFQALTFSLAMQPPTEQDLIAWFSGHDGNIGIVTGYRNLAVIDFDSPDSFSRWQRHSPDIAATAPTEATPGGFHVYLSCNEPIESSSIYFRGRKAGHLKALGGFVVCSPSRLQDARYQWLDGQSPFDCEPPSIPDLAAIDMHPTGWVRRHYDRLLGRGYFSPGEEFGPAAETGSPLPVPGTGRSE